ncbi:MAG TPA: helix-turn-helix domain-containing protein [bacterium]|nr:helix-turn-helix domain-containing protein [bacterium]
MDNAEILNETQVADLLKKSVRTIQAWRQTGDGPPFNRVGGRSILYSKTRVIEWFNEREKCSTSEYAKGN